MSAIERFSDTKAYIEAAAGALAAALAYAPATLAVPGGSTARVILPALFARPLDWEKITLTLVDERWVAPDHADSNEALLRSLVAAASCKANVRGLFVAGLTPQDAVAILERNAPNPDVALLGVGDDGHIASLFPNDPAQHAVTRFAAVTRPDHPRITMTARAICDIPTLVVAAGGKTKAGIIERALLAGKAEEIPVRHVLHSNARVLIGP